MSGSKYSGKQDAYLANFPFLWRVANLDVPRNFALLAALRLLQAIFCTHMEVHPDEYWQGTMPAYDSVYGGIKLPWEWSPDF
jgi:alpha-ketoglutarate-dependent taurine dioxygenase